jgi:hypothetical protein
MDRFEERSRAQHLPPEEVARNYDAIYQILNAEGDSPLSQEERTRVAQNVLENAAEPTSINQGMHPTCTVAALEVRTYTRTPSAAARLVSEIATTTHYQTVDGTVIDVDSGSLHQDGDGYRNQASQIFQVGAVNTYWQRHGDIRYEQRPVSIGQLPPDNGERLLDYSQTPPREFTNLNGLPVRQPWLNGDAIYDINSQLTGQREASFVLSRADNEYLTASTQTIDSQNGLETALAQMQRNGQFPVLVNLHARNEPFWADSGSGSAGGSGAWHVVAITSYHPGPPATVALDNTWGSQHDHLTPDRRISTEQLFAAMREPPAQPAPTVTLLPPANGQGGTQH